MPQFFIDKANKVPIYLQIKNQVKYFVSTGALASREQLPPVKTLAGSLSINFLTVRKAYQELEAEGLIEIRHGEGTFVALSPARKPRTAANSLNSQNGLSGRLRYEFEELIRRYELEGATATDAIATVEELLASLKLRAALPTVVFTECNQFQIDEISGLLKSELGMEVMAVKTDRLGETLSGITEKGRRVIVITTGFHVTEVRNAVGDLAVEIEVLITNLNPATRRKLEMVGEKGKFSFICRDRESTLMYKELLKAELGFSEIDMTSCTIYEIKKVQDALRKSDAVLASPPVYDAVRKIAPKRVAVYNVFERVDPMSLKVLKERILHEPQQRNGS